MDRPRPCRSTPAGASSATASARGGLITLWMPDGIRVLRRPIGRSALGRAISPQLAIPAADAPGAGYVPVRRELAGHTRPLIVVGP